MRNQRRNTIYDIRNTKGAILILALCLMWLMLPQGVCLGADYCVRSGATGNNTGSDWTNAWTDLSEARLPTGELGLERGATYYIADGTYGRHNFNDAVDGEKYIYIKKAIESDHGTDLGWYPEYGDGQAVFELPTYNDRLSFVSSYWIFDGQVGGGPDDWHGDITPLGFKITGPTTGDYGLISSEIRLINIGTWNDAVKADNYVFSHIEIVSDEEWRPGDYPDWGGDGDHANSKGIVAHVNTDFHNPPENVGPHNVTISHCFFNTLHKPIHVTGGENWTIEYNCFYRNTDDVIGDIYQADTIHSFGCDKFVVRHNLFEDSAGNAIITFKSHQPEVCPDTDVDDWDIYGNVWVETTDDYNLVTGAHRAFVAHQQADGYFNSVTSIKFYDNAIIGAHTSVNNADAGVVWLDYNEADGDIVSGNVAYNNIIYDFSSSNPVDEDLFRGVNDVSHNWYYNIIYAGDDITDWVANVVDGNGQVGMGDPFVNWQAMDFSLTSATEPGLDLGAPYNIDMFGNIRGQDGNWDRGAIEYVASTFLYGDVSGDGTISGFDASMAARYAVGLISLSSEQIDKADVTDNGSVSATDAAWIARRAVDPNIVFPVEQ